KSTTCFLYKSMHRAHHIGKYWLHIPQNEERATCTYCPGVMESLDHILLKCQSPGQTEI
ncbi:hypothetical protein C8F04DRAFT_948886, partial [Mycena alexandri]